MICDRLPFDTANAPTDADIVFANNGWSAEKSQGAEGEGAPNDKVNR